MKPTVISAFFFTTSNYDDQYGSSFTTHFDNGVKDRLVKATDRGRNINSISLSTAVNDAISMTAKRGSIIDIPGGWGEKRLSFIITFLISDYAGSTQRQVLTGFTDYNGVSMVSGELDDQMDLFINNSIIIRDTVLDTGRGRILRPRIESSEYVIRGRGRNEGQRGLRRDRGERLIRPHDIFNDVGIQDYQRYHSGGDQIIDTRADLVGDIKMGSRRENNAADYISTVLKAGVLAETMEQPSWNPDSALAGEEMSKSELAAGAVNLSKTEDNPLFAQFLQECDFYQEGVIRLEDLARMVDWPETYRGQPVTQFINPKQVEERGYKSYERGRGNNLGGAGVDAVAVRIISQAVPSILMTNHISDAMIAFSNDNDIGEMQVEVWGERPLIPGSNVSGAVNAVRQLIEYQVAKPVSHNGQMIVTCTIDCSAITDIKINLSLDGQPEELYVIPMYCDGLISPQKTDDYDLASKIVTDLQSTITELADSQFSMEENRIDDALTGFSWGGNGRF
ncbi:hypothetical protein MOA67_gp325 [Klebsiella phage KpLz-2_45]|uniref:hypothetical protein n=1 Tax=Klebsiella phage KpLz-2_45 TaxID=2698923 RepID=UPI001F1471A9|nr:hypothetical protein MOA67_gp325 [Klebsiella phage KpLz-2_45]UKS72098.1 hypothetical protein KpLz245_2320 [Klebsiella phage KpLz-2_45]